MTIRPAGVVLAGGRSTRMGTDKRVLVVDGQRLVDRALHALDGAGVVPRLVSGHDVGELPTEVELIADADADSGPLGGIVSTWAHISKRYPTVDSLVVLACDLPQLEPTLVAELVAAASATSHGAVAHDGAFEQPLVAAYRRRALEHMAAAWEAGERSVRRLFKQWDLAVVPAAHQVADADSPSDLAKHTVIWPTGHSHAESK